MLIAALISFAVLLLAWISAPNGEPRPVARPMEDHDAQPTPEVLRQAA